jgi:two-component sensor histidine kinase
LSQELERAQDRLREARHRLRNQLHSVVATLSAQQAAELSPQTRKALQSSIARVAAITVVNDLLTSDLSAEIPLLGTLEVLARQLVSQMGAEGRLRVRGEGQGLALEGRRAAAVAMLAAELVANAVEHGFWGNRRGMVAVRLDMEQELGVLEVCDDGCGFPPGFDPHRSGGLGWRLVTRMVRRDLGGEVTVENRAGARVRVEFPVESGASSGERKR